MPGDPITPRGRRMCWSMYKFYTHASPYLTFSHTPPSSLLLAFVFLIPWQFTPFGGRLDFVACWLCLAPSGFTTRGCNPLTPKAPKYYDGRCSTARVCRGDAHFPICVRIAAKTSKEFSGNEGAECTRWTQEPPLIVVQVVAWC